MILCAKIVKKGVIRLREEIYRRTGVKLLVTSNASAFKEGSILHFRYGTTAPLPYNLRHLESGRGTIEGVRFLKDKRKVAQAALDFGLHAPEFVQGFFPNQEDYPIIVRETLDSFGGKGMHVVQDVYEFLPAWRGNYWWCPVIPSIREFRFHIAKSALDGKIEIIRVMEKKPKIEEAKDMIIKHVKNFKYSRRYKPYEKYPEWCEQIHGLAEVMPGWLYSLDVGVTPDNELIIFEANTASGIDNGCAKDYAQFIIKELGLKEL